MQIRSQVSHTNSSSAVKNNKGFSLVEMIIVIAIIAILTGISFITLSLLQSAKAKEAAVTFESEISDVITKSKGQMIVVSGVQKPEYYYALKIYKDGGNNYVIRGVYDTSTNTYLFNVFDNPNGGKGREISPRVTVKYYNPDNGTEVTVDDTGVCLAFDTYGRCIDGAGNYRFYKNNGNNIANVTVQKNGSHQSN